MCSGKILSDRKTDFAVDCSGAVSDYAMAISRKSPRSRFLQNFQRFVERVWPVSTSPPSYVAVVNCVPASWDVLLL